ncbi:MAG: hypothetical protein ABJC74_09935 [Gemmatimonadota bacterium]
MFLLAFLVLSAPAAAHSLADTTGITITLAHGTAAERETKSQLERLLHQYDLHRWFYTRAVVIDESAIPHSHPVLTLHTRHRKDDDLLLSTFLHEELHWYVAAHRAGADSAIVDLKGLFPRIPVGYPEGSSDDEGNYVHLIVVWLEQRTTAQAVGELRASQVIAFWASDHYTWIYRALQTRGGEIGRILRSHGLLEPILPQP